MKKIAKANIAELFKAISAQEKLYIPVDEAEGQANFKLYEDGMTLAKELNTVRSAKDVFFPQTENIYKTKMVGKTVEVYDGDEEYVPFTVFGVRACDARSFDVLDKVYYYADPKDSFYSARRDNGTIITLACSAPEETCFCTTFGINPAAPSGDISAWEDGENFYFQANNEKGEKLLAALPVEDAADNAADAVKAEIEAVMDKLPLKGLDLSPVGAGKTKELWDNPVWDEFSKTCIGCGTCTFVCPTCQCFDIREFDNGTEVRRYRCWDSCMYKDFTQMSAGQPRPTQKERFRQRFMHKLVYFPDQHDMYACVGCGRCLKKCPIHMNIVKVVKKLAEVK